ncbi:MAG: AAA family ATPase [Patescibacteria group bacterium]
MKYNKIDINFQQEDFYLNVTLRNLGDVNYFAGESHSGKSLLLNRIYKEHENVVSIKDSPFMSEFWDDKITELDDLLKFNNIILDVIDYKQASNLEFYNETLEEVGSVIEEFGQFESKMINSGKDTKPTGSSTSIKKVYNLIFWVVFCYLSKNTTEFIIDEPECHLHPYITKTIPLLLEYLAGRYEIQFFVATHSPFILSAVARITYEETSIKQTVYFLKDGKLIDKYGKSSENAQMGYWGQKLIPVANSLLGSGIEDLYIEQDAAQSEIAPILVLCEGQAGDEDAHIYNIIFDDLKPHVLFASCRGSSQLYRSFQLLNEVRPGLSANLKIYMIRDRDAEFPTMEAVAKWERDNPGAKILSKRAIECYLFNSETARLLNEKYNQKSDPNKLQNLDRLQQRIMTEVQHGVKTSNYKIDLALEFNKSTNFLLEQRIPEDKHYETLANLVTQNTKNYKDLFNDIFR